MEKNISTSLLSKKTEDINPKILNQKNIPLLYP